jgi:hypothetical protein
MTPPERSGASTAIHVVLLVATLVFLIAMIVNSFLAYFTLGGERPTITRAEILTFYVLVGIAIVIPVAGAIWAFIRGRWVFGILHLLAILVVASAAVVFAIPHDALTPPAPLPRQHSTYTPCYSGSGTCPGG